jgi:hypothetical protein
MVYRFDSLSKCTLWCCVMTYMDKVKDEGGDEHIVELHVVILEYIM